MTMNRRRFLQGTTVTAATVVGYSPVRRAWATQPGPDVIDIPNLDGQFVLAGELLAQAADDFGHIVSNAPTAVLLPGSAKDIERLVKFARKHDVKVGGMSMIGNTHSAYGQSQVGGGVVIDMSALCEIDAVDGDGVWVDAGVRWFELLQATVPLGKSPPILVDHIDLSVGGVLSVGGIGGQTFRHGMMADNVLELEVITGEGKKVHCSRDHHGELFEAVCGGLGQFAIIVRARVRLIDVQPQVRMYTAYYDALTDMMADQEMLLEDGRFDYIEGFAEARQDGGGWIYKIELAKYHATGEVPDDAAMVGDLSYNDGSLVKVDTDYYGFTDRIAPLIELLKQVGAWGVPHPWIDTFVPRDAAAEFIQDVLDQTTPADTGNGPILIYPYRRDRVKQPFLAQPDSDVCYLFSLLRFAIPPTPEHVQGLVAKNRAIYEQLRDLGGKRYPISAIPFAPADWIDHFGSKWGAFVAAKSEYDPEKVLTPGQGIFT
jgi:FAD/FMN-containing dehydrogenase